MGYCTLRNMKECRNLNLQTICTAFRLEGIRNARSRLFWNLISTENIKTSIRLIANPYPCFPTFLIILFTPKESIIICETGRFALWLTRIIIWKQGKLCRCRGHCWAGASHHLFQKAFFRSSELNPWFSSFTTNSGVKVSDLLTVCSLCSMKFPGDFCTRPCVFCNSQIHKNPCCRCCKFDGRCHKRTYGFFFFFSFFKQGLAKGLRYILPTALSPIVFTQTFVLLWRHV